MSDVTIRILEKNLASDPTDEQSATSLYRERLRLGLVTEEQIWLAARLGVVGAGQAHGRKFKKCSWTDRRFRRKVFNALSLKKCVAVCLDAIVNSVSLFVIDYPKHIYFHDIVDALKMYVCASGEDEPTGDLMHKIKLSYGLYDEFEQGFSPSRLVANSLGLAGFIISGPRNFSYPVPTKRIKGFDYLKTYLAEASSRHIALAQGIDHAKRQYAYRVKQGLIHNASNDRHNNYIRDIYINPTDQYASDRISRDCMESESRQEFLRQEQFVRKVMLSDNYI